MNDAKYLYDDKANILVVKGDRSRESGIIGRHNLMLKHGDYISKNKVVDVEEDLYLLDGFNMEQQVPFYGELALVECSKSDYDPYVDFMFYTQNGVALINKDLNVIYHSPTGKLFENKKDLFDLLYLYGPSVLVYMDPADYLNKKIQTKINDVYKQRVKLLREKCKSINMINLEKYQFEKVIEVIGRQAQSEFGNSY